jgi:hypothetical protein
MGIYFVHNSQIRKSNLNEMCHSFSAQANS